MSISEALLSRRRRVWACGSLLVMGAGVVAYRTYRGEEPVAGWSYLLRVRKALRKYSEAFLVGSDISSLLLKDLQTFLASDAEELPQSFKQLLRLAQSQVKFLRAHEICSGCTDVLSPPTNHMSWWEHRVFDAAGLSAVDNPSGGSSSQGRHGGLFIFRQRLWRLPGEAHSGLQH